MINAEPRALERNDVPRVKNPQTPIVLAGLNCQGTETSVGSCGREQVVEYCAHSDYVHGSDAGANCTNIKGTNIKCHECVSVIVLHKVNVQCHYLRMQ